MGLFKGKKKNWMIVLNKFHCRSYGFKHEILIGVSKKEAEAYAMLAAKEWKGCDIPSVCGTAIELPDSVHVVHQKHLVNQ